MGPERDITPSSGVDLSLAQLVRVLREEVPLTQEELAHRAGLSVGTVRGLESGRVRRPRSGSVRMLARALGLTGPARAALSAAARGARVPAARYRAATSRLSDAPTVDRAPRVVPAQLPPAVADFTGREKDVARLEQVLADDVDGSCAVTISAVAGRGGVGKTALAVYVAHRLVDRFPDGQLYVNLHGTRSELVEPARALARFLRAFGLEESSLPEELDERAELYRAQVAGRRCLVVLDDAASERQVRPLLPGSPHAAVLVTSRRRLTGLEGARLVDLDVFEPAEAVEFLGRMMGPERSQTEPRAAHELAGLCGYLPLAVRIAGARLAARPHWRIAQLVERLADERRRLDELAEGDLEVRASIGLGYVALPEAARRALRLLGLLEAAEFGPWYVAALLDTTVDHAVELLDTLSTARLVEVVGVDPTGDARYRLHDLVRLYARERVEQEEADTERAAALGRTLGAWLALADEAATALQSPHSPGTRGHAPRWCPGDRTRTLVRAEPLTWFETERPGLVAAVAQASAMGLDELAWELAASASAFFDQRGLLDDWELTHTTALVACRTTGNERGCAAMERNLTILRDHPAREDPGDC